MSSTMPSTKCEDSPLADQDDGCNGDHWLKTNCSVPFSMQRKLFALLKDFPDGIPISKLQEYFQDKFGTNIDVYQYEAYSVVQLVTSLPNIFRQVNIPEENMVLFCAQSPVGEAEKLLRNRSTDWTPSHVKENVKRLLLKAKESNPDLGGIYFDEFVMEYEKTYSAFLDLQMYGMSSLEQFVRKHKGTLLDTTLVNDRTVLVPPPMEEEIELKCDKQWDLFELHKLSRDRFPEDCVPPHEFLPPLDLKTEFPVGKTIAAIIPCAVSCDHFYISLKKNYLDLQEMMDNMTEFYSFHDKNSATKMPNWVSVSGVFAATYYRDEGWQRVQIEKPISQHVMQCYYVDHGYRWNLKKENIRYLHKDFAHMPQQAVYARLHQADPTGPLWSLEANKRLYDLTEGQHITATVIECEPEIGKVTVSLMREGKDILDILVEEGLARRLQPLGDLEDSDTDNVVFEMDEATEMYNPDDEKVELQTPASLFNTDEIVELQTPASLMETLPEIPNPQPCPPENRALSSLPVTSPPPRSPSVPPYMVSRQTGEMPQVSFSAPPPSLPMVIPLATRIPLFSPTPRATFPYWTPPRATSPYATPPRATSPYATPPRATSPYATPPRATSPYSTPSRATSPFFTPPSSAMSSYSTAPSHATSPLSTPPRQGSPPSIGPPPLMAFPVPPPQQIPARPRQQVAYPAPLLPHYLFPSVAPPPGFETFRPTQTPNYLVNTPYHQALQDSRLAAVVSSSLMMMAASAFAHPYVSPVPEYFGPYGYSLPAPQYMPPSFQYTSPSCSESPAAQTHPRTDQDISSSEHSLVGTSSSARSLIQSASDLPSSSSVEGPLQAVPLSDAFVARSLIQSASDLPSSSSVEGPLQAVPLSDALVARSLIQSASDLPSSSSVEGPLQAVPLSDAFVARSLIQSASDLPSSSSVEGPLQAVPLSDALVARSLIQSASDLPCSSSVEGPLQAVPSSDALVTPTEFSAPNLEPGAEARSSVTEACGGIEGPWIPLVPPPGFEDPEEVIQRPRPRRQFQFEGQVLSLKEMSEALKDKPMRSQGGPRSSTSYIRKEISSTSRDKRVGSRDCEVVEVSVGGHNLHKVLLRERPYLIVEEVTQKMTPILDRATLLECITKLDLGHYEERLLSRRDSNLVYTTLRSEGIVDALAEVHLMPLEEFGRFLYVVGVKPPKGIESFLFQNVRLTDIYPEGDDDCRLLGAYVIHDSVLDEKKQLAALN